MRFRQWWESIVPTDALSEQIFKSITNLLDGDWVIERQDKPHLLQFGGVVIIGKNVMRQEDQYLIGVRWSLLDSQGHPSGLYSQEKPVSYDSIKGDAQVSMYFGVQGYKPGDKGALGGIILVKNKPMTPIGHVVSAKTPYEIAVKARKIIEDYNMGEGPDDGDDDTPEPNVPVSPRQTVLV